MSAMRVSNLMLELHNSEAVAKQGEQGKLA